MNKELTNKQLKVLQAIKNYIKGKGKSPTFEELRQVLGKKGMKLKSNNSIVQYLNVLEEKGFIQKFSKTRGIRILTENMGKFVTIPLLGQADCGEALSYADDVAEDYINISKEYIKNDENDYFFIKASGDSMDKSNIKNNDLVLVKKINGTPHDNQDIVAVINGLGTIKKFKMINGTPVLFPNSNNPKHQPIILYSGDQVNICGEVNKVFNFSAMEDNSRNS